ncbi:hypothetical protein Dimus_032272 [Dionaea muscipula]
MTAASVKPAILAMSADIIGGEKATEKISKGPDNKLMGYGARRKTMRMSRRWNWTGQGGDEESVGGVEGGEVRDCSGGGDVVVDGVRVGRGG